MSKQKARIDDWTEVSGHLYGRISGHPRQNEFGADRYQRTSRLVSINHKAGTAETMNTIYTLGSKA